MPRRVASPYESRFGTGTDKNYVPLDPATCCILSLLEEACCFPTCAQGSSASVTKFPLLLRSLWENGVFWGSLVLLSICFYGRYWLCWFTSFMYTGSGLRRCAYRRTGPLGEGRRVHYLRDLHALGRLRVAVPTTLLRWCLCWPQ